MISVALNLKFIFYNGYFFYYINFINKYIIKCVFTLSNYFNSIEISIYIRQRVIVLVIYSFFLLSSSVFFFFFFFFFYVFNLSFYVLKMELTIIITSIYINLY